MDYWITGLLQCFLQDSGILFHGGDVGIQCGFVGFACYHRVKGIDFCACFPADSFSSGRGILRLGEQHLHWKLIHVLNGFLQLGRSRLCARLTLNYLDDVQVEFLGKIREGLMEGYYVAMRQGVQLGMELCLQGLQLVRVGYGISFVGCGMLRVSLCQLGSNVVRLASVMLSHT